MYLLGSQEVSDLISRDQNRPIFGWLQSVELGESDLFVSALSLGQVSHMVELLNQPDRDHWRRLLAQGRRTFDDRGCVLGVDLGVVDVWASGLRGMELIDVDPQTGENFELGEDDRLIIATAIARGYSLVTKRTPALNMVAQWTTLTIVEP
jgi:predicted nucleic acid-binding protein